LRYGQTSMKHVVIIDYGVGNLRSLVKVFGHFGVDVSVSEDPSEIAHADALVLPGVGSFKAGMRGLRLRGLLEAVVRADQEKKPILGICLGAQLLFDEGHEFGVHKGLGIIEGTVSCFPHLSQEEKIPQVGWNSVHKPEGVSWTGGVLDGLGSEPEFYFVHSYIMVPEKIEYVFGLTTYGGTEFCSVVKKGNTLGVQFHPEKSAKVGLALIKSYIDLVEKNAE